MLLCLFLLYWHYTIVTYSYTTIICFYILLLLHITIIYFGNKKGLLQFEVQLAIAEVTADTYLICFSKKKKGKALQGCISSLTVHLKHHYDAS